MEMYEGLMARRSVRVYQEKGIPGDALAQIMNAALMAPSAMNLQPWYFIVIESEEAMKELKETMKDVAVKMQPNLEKRFPNHPDVVKESNRFIADFGGAPVCVLAFQYKPDYDKTESTIVQSVSAAIENMILAAWDLGIGSCWISAPLETGYDEYLKKNYAPDRGKFVAMITLGYPEKVAKAPKRRDGRVTFL